MSRSENHEFPVIYLFLLATVLVFLFIFSTGNDQPGDCTRSPALSHAQAMSPVLPEISNQPVPTTATEPGISFNCHAQERLGQNLQRITRVLLMQTKIESFQRLLCKQQQFYYHYFSGGKTDIPSYC
jgi:hypothetical protein